MMKCKSVSMKYTHEVNELKNIDSENMDVPAMLAMIKRSYIRYIDHEIQKEDINSGEFPFLLVLNEKDKITQKELADSLRTSEGLVTRVLKKLEKNGYVSREVDSNNKRRNIISITPKGRQITEKIIIYQNNWEKATFSFLTDDELKKFKQNLKFSLINAIEVENGIE